MVKIYNQLVYQYISLELTLTSTSLHCHSLHHSSDKWDHNFNRIIYGTHLPLVHTRFCIWSLLRFDWGAKSCWERKAFGMRCMFDLLASSRDWVNSGWGYVTDYRWWSTHISYSIVPIDTTFSIWVKDCNIYIYIHWTPIKRETVFEKSKDTVCFPNICHANVRIGEKPVIRIIILQNITHQEVSECHAKISGLL